MVDRSGSDQDARGAALVGRAYALDLLRTRLARADWVALHDAPEHAAGDAVLDALPQIERELRVEVVVRSLLTFAREHTRAALTRACLLLDVDHVATAAILQVLIDTVNGKRARPLLEWFPCVLGTIVEELRFDDAASVLPLRALQSGEERRQAIAVRVANHLDEPVRRLLWHAHVEARAREDLEHLLGWSRERIECALDHVLHACLTALRETSAGRAEDPLAHDGESAWREMEREAGR